MKLWRYSGLFLFATGIIHTIIALALGWDSLCGIVKDGLINTIGADLGRNQAFWFLVCGVVLIFFGHTLHYYIRKEQEPAPLLLIFTIVGCLIIPVSGFWLFLPQALIIILAKRKQAL